MVLRGRCSPGFSFPLEFAPHDRGSGFTREPSEGRVLPASRPSARPQLCTSRKVQSEARRPGSRTRAPPTCQVDRTGTPPSGSRPDPTHSCGVSRRRPARSRVVSPLVALRPRVRHALLPGCLSLRPLSAAPRASLALHRKPPNPHSRASPGGDPGDPRFWRKPSGWTSETHPGRLVGPPVARRTSSSGILPLIDTAREFGEKATRGVFVLRARPSTGVGGRVWSLRTLGLGVDAPSPERRDPLLASSSTLPSEQLSPSVRALEVRLVSEIGRAHV